MSTRQLNNRAEIPSIFMVDLTLHNIVVKRLKKLISDKGLDICSKYLIQSIFLTNNINLLAIAQLTGQSQQYIIHGRLTQQW